MAIQSISSSSPATEPDELARQIQDGVALADCYLLAWLEPGRSWRRVIRARMGAQALPGPGIGPAASRGTRSHSAARCAPPGPGSDSIAGSTCPVNDLYPENAVARASSTWERYARRAERARETGEQVQCFVPAEPNRVTYAVLAADAVGNVSRWLR